MILYFPGIVSGREFIAIPLQVLWADLVKNADNTAFQQAPKVFDTIGVKTAIHVLACLVVYHIVFKPIILAQESIHSLAVCYYIGAVCNVLFNQMLCALFRDPIRDLYDHLPARLTNPNYRIFGIATTA